MWKKFDNVNLLNYYIDVSKCFNKATDDLEYLSKINYSEDNDEKKEMSQTNEESNIINSNVIEVKEKNEAGKIMVENKKSTIDASICFGNEAKTKNI